MKKKKIVIALGHEALGTTLPEQKEATKRTAKAVADFIREDYQVVITHSNGPQIGMIHTAMNEFCKLYPEYTATPMSVCSAMRDRKSTRLNSSHANESRMPSSA